MIFKKHEPLETIPEEWTKKDVCEECEVRNCSNTATFKIPKQEKFEGVMFCTAHAKAAKSILKSIGNPEFRDTEL